MRAVNTFHCNVCQSLLFFENVSCLGCGHMLAYLPDTGTIAALEQDASGLYHPTPRVTPSRAYRLCANYTSHQVCNWAVAAEDEHTLCRSCRLTRMIPDISAPESQAAWYRLEAAKRRVIYTLRHLALPLDSKQEAADGLAFDFLQDTVLPNGDSTRVLTGHDNGVITINVAETDDLLREQQRREHNEPYRTLLGHFRHETGHYYWDRLVRDGPSLEEFRARFGDERADYGAALRRHYEQGPPPRWDQDFVSAYASSHPWEDWAESWAHYLHMTDALETASSMGLSLRPIRRDEPSMPAPADPLRTGRAEFDQMMEGWLPLTYMLNNLSRGLGQRDNYPFVLSPAVIDKLRFVHQVIIARRPV